MTKRRLSPRERELARHALGLTDGRTRSYRNRFVAGKGHADHPDWLRLVKRGLAGRRAGVKMFGGSDLFWLTRQGAELALKPGETLDPEDFPDGAP